MNDGSKNAPAPAPVLGLHHNAYRYRDAEETRHFYEDVLGLPLVHVVKEQFVPSTGEKSPFAHLFFELKDGSCIAFFDLGDNVKPEPSPNTPAASHRDRLFVCRPHRRQSGRAPLLPRRHERGKKTNRCNCGYHSDD